MMKLAWLLGAALGVALIVDGCANGGTANNCQSGEQPCGAMCVDTTANHDNCGSCGKACAVAETCISSHCMSGSSDAGGDATLDGGKCPGQTLCGSMCVNVQTDPNHCGNCTTLCYSGVETCTAGSCTSTCTGGQTLCVPDAGVVDGGPTAHCANLQTDLGDCGYCFNACPGGSNCTMGMCVSTLLGSGTAADPWHTMTALANCADYLKQFPTAMDGVYTTHPASTDIGVYCDMTHGGTTFEDFGFGQYTGTYTGYAFVGVADFTGTTQFDAAFAYLYSRAPGLTNLNPGGWTDGNCCIENTTSNTRLGLAGSSYMEPAVSGTVTCATSYSATYIELALGGTSVLTSITQSQAAMATSTTNCGLSGNPGIFVKKY